MTTPDIFNGSLSDRVASAIVRRMRQAGSAADQALPSERRLAGQLRVARSTVRAALDQLEQSGLVRRDGQVRRLVDGGGAEAGVLSNTIAVLTREHDYSRRDWLELVEFGAIQAARSSRLHSMVLHTGNLPGEQSLARFLQDPPMGLVVCATIYDRPAWRSIAERFIQAGCRVVLEGTDDHGLTPVKRVGSDHAAGAAALTDLLLQHGRRRIVGYYPNTRHHAYWVQQRIAGHDRAMRASGLEPLPALFAHPLMHGDRDRADYHAHAIQALGYLTDYRNRHGGFDAIMAASDANVPFLYEALQLMGLRPGEDVVVTGYDHYWHSAKLDRFGHPPPLATVDKQEEKVGQRMVQCILEGLHSEPNHQPLLVEPQLIELDIDTQPYGTASSRSPFASIPSKEDRPMRNRTQTLTVALTVLTTLGLIASAHAAITTDMTGHYRLDEASGDTLVNSGTLGAPGDGFLLGPTEGAPTEDRGDAPARVSGFIGAGALDFDGVNDVATLADASALLGAGTNQDGAVSLWFNADTTAATSRLVVFQHDRQGTNFGIDLNATGPVVQGRYRSDTAPDGSIINTDGITTLSTDTWYHAVWAHAAGSTGAYNLYLNGLLEASTSGALGNSITGAPGVPGRDHTVLGAFDNIGGSPSGDYDGSLDDIAVWTRDLTHIEVAALHAMGRFESLDASDTLIDDLIAAFNATGSTTINGNPWQYTTGLAGAKGATGGTADLNAFVVLDDSGNGMQIIPEPASLALLGLGGLLMAAGRRTTVPRN